VKAKIGRVEFCNGDQVVPLEDLHGTVTPPDQARLAKIAHQAADVDGGQAKRIAEHPLGEREIEDTVSGQTDDLESQVKFRQQVGELGEAAAPAHGGDPLPVNGGVDDGVEPR
jgi:hypothetical protein